MSTLSIHLLPSLPGWRAATAPKSNAMLPCLWPRPDSLEIPLRAGWTLAAKGKVLVKERCGNVDKRLNFQEASPYLIPSCLFTALCPCHSCQNYKQDSLRDKWRSLESLESLDSEHLGSLVSLPLPRTYCPPVIICPFKYTALELEKARQKKTCFLVLLLFFVCF